MKQDGTDAIESSRWSSSDASKGQFMIKVCGITNLDDATLSLQGGANALGFNFYPESPRFIEPEQAARIIGKLPQETLTVAIVVSQTSSRDGGIKKKRKGDRDFKELVETGVGAIQIHGVSGEMEIPDLGLRTLVATSPERADQFPHFEIIIDTSWGSGTKADWERIRELLNRSYILSGGLTPENVGKALRMLEPAGVDVCSGVEAAPGKKDQRKLLEFLSVVRTFCDDSGSNY